MPIELLVPRRKVYFSPLDEGRFIPIADDVPEIWRQPYIRRGSGKVEGFESGWRSGLSYASGDLYKFKGCRPTGGVIENEPEGSQTFSLAQYEADAVLKRREVYLKEGLPYPLEPVGFWVYGSFKYKDEPNAATVYKALGDTRLDEYLWWIEKDLPYNYLFDKEEYLVDLFCQVGMRVGSTLKLSHDNSLTWDAGEGASNAHLGNVLLFPYQDLVGVAGVDFDNSLNFQNGIDSDDEEEDLSKIREQDLRTLVNSTFNRRVISRATAIDYTTFGIADKLVDRMLKRVLPELVDEREAVRNYLLDYMGDSSRDTLRGFLAEVVARSYHLGGGNQRPVLWNDLLILRQFVDVQKREFVQRMEARLKERADTDALILSAKKHSILRGLSFPITVDSESITLLAETREEVDTPIPDEQRAEEVLNLARNLLSLHQAHIIQHPADGKNYFSYPKVPRDILDAHFVLRREDVIDIVRLWVEDDSRETLVKEFSPRAIGSFLLTLTQLTAQYSAEAVKAAFPKVDDPQLITKLCRVNEFFELLPPGVQSKDFNFKTYVYKLAGKDVSFEIERETEVKTGMALFAFGVITEIFTNKVFNHHDLDVILNEFRSEHIPALQAALQCPELLDPVNGRAASDNALGNALIALTGTQVREGQLESLALLSEQSTIKGEFRSAILQYLLASMDKEEITDPALKEALEASVDKGWIVSMIRHLLISGKNLHPNSYLAYSLREAEFESEEVVKTFKVFLDRNNGDLSKLDPTLKLILDRPSSGPVSKDAAAGLVMACLGLGIDLPDSLQAIINENKSVFMDSLSISRITREGGIYETLPSYPVNPIYRLISAGVSALPAKIRVLFEEFGDNQEVMNSLAASLLESMFIDDYSYGGYFRCFFGGMWGSKGYPKQELYLNDFGQVRANDKKQWQLWRIVHPDIWNIISLADTEVLTDYVKTQLPKGTVKMDFGIRNGMVGFRESHLSECLPPNLYRKIIQKD